MRSSLGQSMRHRDDDGVKSDDGGVKATSIEGRMEQEKNRKKIEAMCCVGNGSGEY